MQFENNSKKKREAGNRKKHQQGQEVSVIKKRQLQRHICFQWQNIKKRGSFFLIMILAENKKTVYHLNKSIIAIHYFI